MMDKRQISLVIGLSLPLAALLVLISWMPTGPTAAWQPVVGAQSNIITVTTGLDNTAVDPVDPSDCSGDLTGCTLREAIARAESLGGDVLITFDQPYTITLTYRAPPGTGPVLPLDANNAGGSIYLDNPDLNIDGDLNDDCVPDVVINGENITTTNKAGLRLSGDGGTIQGLVIQNFQDYGISISGGDNLTIACNYIGTDRSGRQAVPNRLGVYILREAHDNVVVHNVIAGNSQNGVHISARPGFENSQVPYSNTVSSNWIGTNPFGDALGNASKGVLIQHNARDNLIYDNLIRYNGCYGVHLRGRNENNPFDPYDDDIFPPRGNRIISNTITSNNENACPGVGAMATRAGLVNEDTHLAISNTVPSLAAADYDNVIASNVISANGGDSGALSIGFGIFNLGASPLISDNLVQGNADHGIFNQVDFNPDFSPQGAAEDILSVPLIQDNAIQDNGGHGIRSLDTSPVAPYQLHIANTVQNNNLGAGGVDVSQAWFGLVELLYGNLTDTLPITQSAAPVVTNLSYPGYRYELYQPISVGAPYSSTVWADNNGDTYWDVRTWEILPQFEVIGGTDLRDYYPQRVVVDLLSGLTLTETFSFDGLTTTHAVTNDLLIPAYVTTGPFGRYQVAQVYALLSSGDDDGDGIPSTDECPGGPPCDDSDDDGIPDYLDPDDDGDGIPSVDECPGGPPCDDTDGDGIPDYLDPDDDGDGIPSVDECPGGPPCDDTDGDGIPDYLDPDDDGDGIPSLDECPGGPPCDDTDGDGIPDYLDPDDDGDGIPSLDECPGGPPCDDSDGDGIPDYLDPDDDGDGILSADECPGGPPCADSDGDGIADYLDPDDDNDGILTDVEYDWCVPPDTAPCDADADGIPDYLDQDSDGDEAPDADEYDACSSGAPHCVCQFGNPPGCYLDSDDDGMPDWLDPHYYIYLPFMLRNF
jgi:hypothetical protein